ncbi:SapC family protein [Cognatilysobacter terrigena]|uniref:SapC family protein n=1 Tax=Cognatilysobacter terrigena TaxID=2488749 RepID=UPI00105D1FF2|nr:SapC family protein [Lysobacter terrigena]
MPRPVLLNNVDHAELRIDTRHAAELGDDVMVALTFPAEFRDVQAHYPIVFAKTPDGRTFQPVALLGLCEGENLFLDGDRWDASYVPLAIARQPFLIGHDNGEPIIHVDVEHPRVGTRGERVFREFGGTTDYLERISSTLRALHEGVQATAAFVDALLANDLLESFVLDIQLDDGSQNRLAGFYTIHEERLAQLDGDALAALHRAGHLASVYMAVASLSQLRGLIERMNRRHGGGR